MKAKILIYDIETSPNLAYVWGKWEQNVLAFKERSQIICIAYKWLGDKDVTAMSLRTHSESALVKRLHKLFGEADVTVAHNGDKFDKRKANGKFLTFGLVPPALARSVDTLKIAKKQFYFDGYSLNDLSEYLKVGKKIDTGGFELWQRCMKGEAAAYKLMERYNAHDVTLLEKVYNKLRPWADNHPNVALLEGKQGCAGCGSVHMTRRGFIVTAKTRSQRVQCQDCGKWDTRRAA